MDLALTPAQTALGPGLRSGVPRPRLAGRLMRVEHAFRKAISSRACSFRPRLRLSAAGAVGPNHSALARGDNPGLLDGSDSLL